MCENRNRQPDRWPVLLMLTAGLILLALRPAAAGDTVPFAADFEGEFQILFGAGPDGTDDLRFSGGGIAT